MIKTLTIKKNIIPTLKSKKYWNAERKFILDRWMMEELEKTIDRINKGEEELISFEEWQEELRREYNMENIEE